MIRCTIITTLLALFLAYSMPATSQCLSGNCINGSGSKLTRGHKYIGDFLNNRRNGFGMYEFPGGDRYEGEFVAGHMEGNGMYFFVNGDRYEGEFLNDKRHGVGTYYSANDRSISGVWEAGQLVGPGEEVVSENLDDLADINLSTNPDANLNTTQDENNITPQDTQSPEGMNPQDLDVLVDKVLEQ